MARSMASSRASLSGSFKNASGSISRRVEGASAT